MPYSIKDLRQLSLHDSSLEAATRRGTSLELVFDWAKLTHLADEQIAEPVILGRTTLALTGISQETFASYEEAGAMRAVSPIAGLAKLKLITDNKLLLPDTLVVNGLLNEAAGSNWVEWRITFATSTISWKAFSTQTEWLAGKQPHD
ncbi:hypothetical protein GCM10023172_16020 [Hymenobacter ginsengisoli]|uniref:Uncharacterized protein n=1 Tax=Hymenobacter ginsengisoli TaxID=1051626 RepID=A0ABP8Q8W1_9BACT|nr:MULTISPECIES: hypothetical protein [unclassified Hymenobacter]MBO2030854.1 hypothetical protein [Hymenobacter sp. BT559]